MRRDDPLPAAVRELSPGFDEMLASVVDFPDRTWAVEAANGMGRSVAQCLVAAGETVIDVPAKLSTRVRVYSTGHGTNTDKTDAVATAKAALHSKHLRFVTPGGVNTAAEMRVEFALDHIDDVGRLDRKIDQATARINQMVKESKTTLTRIYGIGPVNAAVFLGEVDNVGRFPTRNRRKIAEGKTKKEAIRALQ